MDGVWFKGAVDGSLGKLGRGGRGGHTRALIFSNFCCKGARVQTPPPHFQIGGGGASTGVDLQAKPPPPVQSRHAGMPTH